LAFKNETAFKRLEQFMTLHDTVTNGVPATTVTLHRVPVCDKANETLKILNRYRVSKPAGHIGFKNAAYKTLLILNKLVTARKRHEERGGRGFERILQERKKQGSFIPRNNAYTFSVSSLKNGDPLLAGIKPSSNGDTNGMVLEFCRNQADTRL
jgi:hypothetical protein